MPLLVSIPSNAFALAPVNQYCQGRTPSAHRFRKSPCEDGRTPERHVAPRERRGGPEVGTVPGAAGGNLITSVASVYIHAVQGRSGELWMCDSDWRFWRWRPRVPTRGMRSHLNRTR